MTKEDLKLFSKIPTLITERLTLRKISVADAEDCYEYSRDPELTRYLLWEPHTSISATRFHLSYIERKYRRAEFYDWAIVIKDKMIGTAGFTSFDLENNSGEIGYVVNSAYRGQGYATEAALAVIDFGFTRLGLERIYARFISENERSRRLLQRCGMRAEGVQRRAILAKGEYRDLAIYAVTRGEWKYKTGAV